MTENQDLHAGIARATVTPPVGIDMQGFAGRGPSTGVHDDLCVTALVLGAGHERAAIVAADLIGFSADQTAAVRQEVERRTGIPAAAVGLCASHTHYGPKMVVRDHEPDPDVRAYHDVLVHYIAGAIQEAAAELEPVHVGVARTECDIGINRRERKPDGAIVLGKNPGGTIDRELILVRLHTADGEPLAALINFAVHGVCQSSKTTTISSDFVDPMRSLFEAAVGSATLYLQGGCGNINPRIMEPDFWPAEQLGVKLGAAALTAYEAAEPVPCCGLAATSRTVPFPSKTYATLEEAGAVIEREQAELDRLKAGQATAASIHWTQGRLDAASAAARSIETGEPLPPVDGEVMSLRFGDVALTTAPGEIFNQIGVTIKRESPIRDTLFLGYSNGSIGYMPVPEAYPEGGYEVDRACRIGPDSAKMLTDEARRQIDCLAAAW